MAWDPQTSAVMLVLYQTEGKTVSLPVDLCCELHLSAHELWEMTKRMTLDLFFCVESVQCGRYTYSCCKRHCSWHTPPQNWHCKKCNWLVWAACVEVHCCQSINQNATRRYLGFNSVNPFRKCCRDYVFHPVYLRIPQDELEDVGTIKHTPIPYSPAG